VTTKTDGSTLSLVSNRIDIDKDGFLYPGLCDIDSFANQSAP